MRDGALLVIMVLGVLLMGSCRSHKTVVGSDGQVIPDQIANAVKPDLAGNADNKYTRALVDEAFAWLGTPYRYGGESRQGTDCSGFTMQVYDNALGIKLPRVSRDQGDAVKPANIRDLMVGDLLFFVTSSNGKVSHVGIYLGGNRMIHSSSSKGVCVSDITDKYWNEHFHHSGYIEDYRKLATAKNKKSPAKQKPATTISQQTQVTTIPEPTPASTSQHQTNTVPTTPLQRPVTTVTPPMPMPSVSPDAHATPATPAAEPSNNNSSKKSRVKRY